MLFLQSAVGYIQSNGLYPTVESGDECLYVPKIAKLKNKTQQII